MDAQESKRKELLEASRTIAMVGLSPKTDKPSNIVARYLKSKGYRVIPVNPNYGEVLGEKSYGKLSEISEKIDVVDIFMRAENVVPVVEEAVKLRPRAIWLQLGIVSDEARSIAERSGIMFIQDRCMKQEHERLLEAAKPQPAGAA